MLAVTVFNHGKRVATDQVFCRQVRSGNIANLTNLVDGSDADSGCRFIWQCCKNLPPV